MTKTLGPKGCFEIFGAASGPTRRVRALSFQARAGDTGVCVNAMFRSGEAIIGVVNLTKGRVVTSSFSGPATGSINLSDTGGLGADGQFAATHEMIAFMLSDTGTAG